MLYRYIALLALLGASSVVANDIPVTSSEAALGPTRSISAARASTTTEVQQTGAQIVLDAAPTARFETVLRWNRIAIDGQHRSYIGMQKVHAGPSVRAATAS
jgi:hypothetical protein